MRSLSSVSFFSAGGFFFTGSFSAHADYVRKTESHFFAHKAKVLLCHPQLDSPLTVHTCEAGRIKSHDFCRSKENEIFTFRVKTVIFSFVDGWSRVSIFLGFVFFRDFDLVKQWNGKKCEKLKNCWGRIFIKVFVWKIIFSWEYFW